MSAASGVALRRAPVRRGFLAGRPGFAGFAGFVTVVDFVRVVAAMMGRGVRVVRGAPAGRLT
ncbi:MAG: hypothetical protein ACLGIK_07465 [Gemmatimonadota bacterium]